MGKIEMILEAIEELQKDLDGIEDGPCGIFYAWPSGMPRGTNDVVSALLQREDVNDKIDKLEDYYIELEKLIS